MKMTLIHYLELYSSENCSKPSTTLLFKGALITQVQLIPPKYVGPLLRELIICGSVISPPHSKSFIKTNN